MIYVTHLGYAHQGFLFGLEDNWARIKAIIGDDPFVIAGHSRGAGEATLMTGLAVRSGKYPLKRIVFGEPRSCDANFAKIISVVPSSSYCNDDASEIDPVVEVPLDIPLVAPYARVKPLTKLRFVAGQNNPWMSLGRIRCHYMPSYLASLEASL